MKKNKKNRTKSFDSAAALRELKQIAGDSHHAIVRRNSRISSADRATVEKIIELLEKIPRSEKRKYWGCSAWGMLISHAAGWRVTRNEAQAVAEKLDLRVGPETRIPVSWLDSEKLRKAAAELRSKVAI